jgi:hypothetical protein
VDGVFERQPAVWHKEILFALSEGIHVYGAASMGALRAAELCQFGMVGIGRIFRLFRMGLWTDDDELAVLHATAELGYCPLSDAMANIRFTFRRLRRMGSAPREVEMSPELHESQTLPAHPRRADSRRLRPGRADAQSLMDDFEREYVDVKKDDAQALGAYLIACPPTSNGNSGRFRLPAIGAGSSRKH